MEDKSTTELAKEEINSSLYLLEVLKKGMISFSALARGLLPKIKEKNRKANFSSVLIAIQRYYDEIKIDQIDNKLGKILKGCELIMKNNISSLTIERTKLSVNLINEVSREIRWDLGDIMFFIQGSGEITVVIDKKNEKRFFKLGKKIIEKKDNLAILSVREAQEFENYSKDVPGYLALLTSTLANNFVNIYDIASTYKQIIFIINEEDLMKAYNALDKLIKHYQQ